MFSQLSSLLQAHSPEAERKAGKQQFEALPQYLSLVTQAARLMAIKLNLQKQSILYLIEELHGAYTDNSGKKRSPVYDSAD